MNKPKGNATPAYGPPPLTEDELYRASIEELNRPDADGRTALHRAVLQGAVDLVETLLSRHVEVNVGDHTGTTPLHEAVTGESLPIISHLLDAGADLNLGDGAHRTPLFYAVKCGFTDIIEMLLERHADINVQDMAGCTPLHEAVESNQFSALNTLLRGRADATIAARDGRTPLELAQHLGRKAMVEVLQRYEHARRPVETPPATEPAPEQASEPAAAPTPPTASDEVAHLRTELEAARREAATLRACQTAANAQAFEALCDAVPGSVYVVRPDGAFLYLSHSAARKLGVKREELLGYRWSAPPFPAQAAELFDQRREEVLASGQPAAGLLQIPANGMVYSYRYIITPLREGEAIGAVMVVLLDDHGKGELEERLTRARYALHETEMKLSRERAAREELERKLAQQES